MVVLHWVFPPGVPDQLSLCLQPVLCFWGMGGRTDLCGPDKYVPLPWSSVNERNQKIRRSEGGRSERSRAPASSVHAPKTHFRPHACQVAGAVATSLSYPQDLLDSPFLELCWISSCHANPCDCQLHNHEYTSEKQQKAIQLETWSS